MTPRRGLTLLEVLASTVLLAVVASVCMPLMQRSMRTLGEPVPAFDLSELARMADAFTARPEVFTGVPLQDLEAFELAWIDASDRAPIIVERLARQAPPPEGGDAELVGPPREHVWLSFTCAPYTVCRWVVLEEPASNDDDGDGDAASGAAEGDVAMRRGMTILELLLALGLLTAITAAIVSWLQVTIHTGARYAEPARWRAAAEAVLLRIQDDVVTGDLGAAARGPRVRVARGVLNVSTRAELPGARSGPTLHRYVLDRRRAELRLESFAGGIPTGRREVRPLLDGVETWSCSIDSERTALTVAIGSADGVELERSYVLR